MENFDDIINWENLFKQSETFKNNKPLGYYESFVTGFWVTGSERANVCGRPAGLGVTKNGSLLISDDLNNTIYHVEYIK